MRVLAFVLWSLLLVPSTAAAEGPLLPTPALTEVERLKVEVQTLKKQLGRAIADSDACRAEIGPIRTRLNAVVIEADGETLATAIEANHPGYRVNHTTWVLEAAPEKPSAKGTP